MKLTTLIVFITLMQLSASTLAQRITLNKTNANLSAVLKEIRKQSGYDIFYDDKTISQDQRVSINVNNATLEETLNVAIGGLALKYDIEGNIITIRKKELSFIDKIKAAIAAIDVAGRVVDENNQPIPGATVKVKDGSLATTTDKNGNFILRSVKENAKIVISIVGYVTQQITAKPQLGSIKLTISNTNLNEVVINKGYYLEAQKFSVGNTVKVTAKDIEKQPVSNPLLALQGRVPGLFITQSTGVAGSGVTVRIQGQNSIGRGNDPLYVVDGVPYESQTLPTLPNMAILGNSAPYYLGSTNGYGNPLSYLNPKDIQSIEVLKDADATAIYGSRAANGAILITTKRAKIADHRVDASFQTGMGSIATKTKLLNTQQYLAMRKEAFRNDGRVPSADPFNPAFAPDLTVWDTTRYTNWQKVLLGNTAHYTDAQASLTGGGLNVRYLVGANYHRETTVFPGSFADKKGSVHVNLNSNTNGARFQFQLSANYTLDDNHLPVSDFTPYAMLLAPNAPEIYNADGSLNWSPIMLGNNTYSMWVNPLGQITNQYNITNHSLVSNALLSYRLLKGLSIQSSFGFRNLQTDEMSTSPLNSVSPDSRPFSQRSAAFSDGRVSGWIIEPQVSYHTKLGKGELSLLAGTTFQQTTNMLQQFNAMGQNSDLILEDIKAATVINATASLQSVYKYAAVYSRASYNLMERYILNLTMRRDGSSRFGAFTQFHNFGSIGAAWLFSNESFFQRNVPFISLGKLRFSYGTTGSDQIGNYQFLNLYSNQNFAATVPYQGATGLAAEGLRNPYLQWEETKKLQAGIDVSILNERIALSATYVNNRSSNQLLSYRLPSQTGFQGIYTNFPAVVENSAWEFSMNTSNVHSKNFSWKTSFNATIPKNKVVDFPGLSTSSYASGIVIGQPLNPVLAYHSLGVDPATGEYIFADKDGKPTSTPNALTDRTVIISQYPTLYSGIENSFQYKGFTLDFLFQYVKQKGQNNLSGKVPGYFQWGSSNYGNQPESLLDRWRAPGDVASMQKVSTTYGGNLLNAYNLYEGSDAAWSDASYLRLKTLSLSWNLPETWKKKMRLRNGRLFANTQNLLTITGYKVGDPETKSLNTLPPLRMVSFGIEVGL